MFVKVKCGDLLQQSYYGLVTILRAHNLTGEMKMRQTFFSGIVVVLFALPIYSTEYGQEKSTPLAELDGAFIAAHTVANKLDLESGGPIILLRDGQIVLINDDTETAAQVILSDYNAFKTFAHIPVAIYLLLGPEGTGEIDDQRLIQVRDYHDKLVEVENNFMEIDLSGDNLDRQKNILTKSKRFLEQVMQQRICSSAELRCFTRCMLPMIKENIACAAASQLDEMHTQVMAWKREIPPAKWHKVRVAIKGAVLARDDNLAKQYFERLLRVKGEGMRLTYMELYFPPTPMQTLLATRSVDRGIGNAVFGDPNRMFRDVLADAARAHIKCLKFE